MKRATVHVSYAIAALAAIALIACSSDEFEGNDPPNYVCEYAPIGETSKSFTMPSPESLGQFDAMALVKVTGHVETGSLENVVNIGEVTKVVDGDLTEDAEIDVRSDFGVCLETGEEYYLLLSENADGDYYEIIDPWSHYWLINNRITLHLDMRKDDLIGQFHGLDPVLFERRFTDITGRTDIEVD